MENIEKGFGPLRAICRELPTSHGPIDNLFMTGEGKKDVTKGLIRLLVQRHAHELAHGQVLGLLLLARAQQGAQFDEVLRRALVLVLMRRARPKAVLVELEALLGGAAEDHRTQAPIAHGQGLHPGGGGLTVPEADKVGAWALHGERKFAAADCGILGTRGRGNRRSRTSFGQVHGRQGCG